MAKDFTVTLCGERGEEFEKVLGTRTLNVLSPFPTMTQLEGKAEPESVYMLDLDLLTDDQYMKLIVHLAAKFGAQPDMVAAAVKALGMPIRATDTVVTVEHPQKWLLDDAPWEWDKRAATEEVEPMSDLDDPSIDEYDSYDDYE